MALSQETDRIAHRSKCLDDEQAIDSTDLIALWAAIYGRLLRSETGESASYPSRSDYGWIQGIRIGRIIVVLMLLSLIGCSGGSIKSSSESLGYSVVSKQYVDWSKKQPADLIQELKRYPNSIYTIWFIPKDWIEKKDVAYLMTLLDSQEPCASVHSAHSSLMGRPGSTVGHEASFLIHGFREGHYPPSQSSSGFTPDKAEIRQWWEAFQKGD